jgi:hypothetical protein
MRPNDFVELMELWLTVGQFAKDVGVSSFSANKWRQRNRIPSAWWAAVLRTRVARRNKITASLLVRLAARERAEAAE